MLRIFFDIIGSIRTSKQTSYSKIKEEITMENKMFCYQCQETAGCAGCTQMGVCGKKPEVAAMQDLLVYVTKGLSAITTQLRAEGKEVPADVNHLITLNLFITITNANFDEEAIVERIDRTLAKKRDLLALTGSKDSLPEAARWDCKGREGYMGKAVQVGVLSTKDEDIRSLRELITYGLKGLSAYSKHANALLEEDEEVDAFLQSALAKTQDDRLGVEELVALALETGKYGVSGMALLDKANTSAYGNPEMTKVNIGVGTRPAILVSGHDLRDLEMLLEQTKGTGIDVYTHSEMLPAHYYPAFKKYSHFVGNYGNAWWKQKEEFESFNGPILMTTNCIVPPKGPPVYHRCGRLSRLHAHSGKDWRGKGLFSDHRPCPDVPASGRTGTRRDYRRICPQSGDGAGGYGSGSSQIRSDQKVCRDGRMRRTGQVPQLLHGFCESAAKRYGNPHGRMCKV